MRYSQRPLPGSLRRAAESLPQPVEILHVKWAILRPAWTLWPKGGVAQRQRGFHGAGIVFQLLGRDITGRELDGEEAQYYPPPFRERKHGNEGT